MHDDQTNHGVRYSTRIPLLKHYSSLKLFRADEQVDFAECLIVPLESNAGHPTDSFPGSVSPHGNVESDLEGCVGLEYNEYHRRGRSQDSFEGRASNFFIVLGRGRCRSWEKFNRKNLQNEREFGGESWSWSWPSFPILT